MNEYDRNIVSLLSKLFTTVFVKKGKCSEDIYLPDSDSDTRRLYIFFEFSRSSLMFSWHGLAIGKGGTGNNCSDVCKLCPGKEGVGGVQAVWLSACATLRHRVIRVCRKVIARSWIWPQQRRRRRLRNNCFPVPPFPVAGPCQENTTKERMIQFLGGHLERLKPRDIGMEVAFEGGRHRRISTTILTSY